MRSILVFFFAFSIISPSLSQVKIVYERDKDNVIRFYAENEYHIPYSITIEFTELRNLSPSGGMKIHAIANPGRTAVTKLTRNVINENDNFRFTSSYHKGNYRARNNENFFYLIPIAEGGYATPLPLTHIENTINKEKLNESYVGVSFKFDSATTICAPRKGIVSDLKIEEELKGSSYSYSALDNYIELYHEDGTFSKISVLKSGSAKVKIGDKVYPGTPLAESAGEKYQSGPHVRMVQSKLVVNDNKFERVTIPVKYHSDELDESNFYGKTVLVSHPKDLVKLEMSKKEIKKLFP